MGSQPLNISGSRAAAVLGLSPYKTQVEVWAEICEQRRPGFAAEKGIVLPPPPDNAAIRWGLAFEEAVIFLAESHQRCKIGYCEHLVCFTTKEGAALSAHLDGIYADNAHGLHEGKTTVVWTFNERWGEPGSNKIPREYQCQIQHQLICARAAGWKAERAIVSVLCWPTRPEQWEEAGIKPSELLATDWADVLDKMGYFHQFEVASDPELQAIMVERYDEFWNRYILPEVAPPVKSMNDIKILFPEPKGTVIADDKTIRMAAEYRQINNELALMNKRKKELAAAIISNVNPNADHVIDKDSEKKLIIRDTTGSKLGSFDGKTWRASKS